MNLREFQKTSVDSFRGLYRRGNTDQVPDGHAIDLVNLDFNKTGETFTRVGSNLSLNLTHPVKRMFLATTTPGNYYVLTYDGNKSLYIYDMQTGLENLLYTDPELKEFYAVNEWGKCYILPAGADYNHNMVMQVIYWSTTYNSLLIRPALGYAPQVPPSGSGIPMMVAVETGTGDIDPGVHKFAVSFITDTGFTTRPGMEDSVTYPGNPVFVPVSYTASGGAGVKIYNIPLGPYGTVARQLFVTKADEEEYFYLADGFINDNTTNVWPTTGVLSWFDMDLAISADSLFDLREFIPGGATTSSGIFKYRGRTLAWGKEGLDLILVSNPGEPEAFDSVTGYIQMPSETDGNYISGAANLRDVLYLTKPVGIYSTQDNFDVPSTWPVVQVDGGVGCTFYAMSTLSSSQTALSFSEYLLFADNGGIHLFDGTVIHPPITWKIDDVWKRVANPKYITMVVDPFHSKIYCLVALDGASQASALLVGTYTDGIDHQAIKWSVYVFPFCVHAIGIMSFLDMNDFQYLLRLGTDSNGLYRLDPKATDDSGTAITSYWQGSLQGFDFGKLSIFRALVIRAEGTTAGTTPTSLSVSLGAQDGQRVQVMNSFSVALQPGMEFTRQINYTSEKMAIKLLSNSKFRLDRLDVYGKVQFDSRPLGA